MFVKEKTFAQKYGIFFFCLFLVVINIYLFRLDFKSSKHDLTFAMLDVGQGDGLFIESPTGAQVLIDAGPPGKVLQELNKVMSPFDRDIDVIIITNPDADHISGFLDVLKVYHVGLVLEPGTFNSSKTYQNLENVIKNKNIKDVLARRGMVLDLGGGAKLNILFPDRDVSNFTANDGSVVARLVYGDTSVMLMGDATMQAEQMILKSNTVQALQSTVLKVGHHGSHTSTSTDFVEIVAPKYAMISDGKDNKYGHPHEETLSTRAMAGVKMLRTDLMGTIIMKSNGKIETFSFNK